MAVVATRVRLHPAVTSLGVLAALSCSNERDPQGVASSVVLAAISSSNQRETPPRKGVASSGFPLHSLVATSVRLHPARGWHLHALSEVQVGIPRKPAFLAQKLYSGL